MEDPLNGAEVVLPTSVEDEAPALVSTLHPDRPNTAGRLVRTLLDERGIEAGQQRIVWDGKDESSSSVGSGTYFIQMEAGEYSEARKVVLVR